MIKACGGKAMTVHTSSLETVHDFLAQKRIAMAGVSHDAKDFSRMLFDEFVRRQYDMVPVNPGASEIAGRRCFARVTEIQPHVEAVILMTSPLASEAVVHDCVKAGIKRVWMYRAGGEGAVSQAAVECCHANGIALVAGECPYMFWSDAHFGHRVHGLINKIIGRYPKRERSAA
jgi:uncharacterized protein